MLIVLFFYLFFFKSYLGGGGGMMDNKNKKTFLFDKTQLPLRRKKAHKGAKRYNPKRGGN